MHRSRHVVFFCLLLHAMSSPYQRFSRGFGFVPVFIRKVREIICLVACRTRLMLKLPWLPGSYIDMKELNIPSSKQS